MRIGVSDEGWKGVSALDADLPLRVAKQGAALATDAKLAGATPGPYCRANQLRSAWPLAGRRRLMAECLRAAQKGDITAALLLSGLPVMSSILLCCRVASQMPLCRKNFRRAHRPPPSHGRVPVRIPAVPSDDWPSVLSG